MKYCTVIYLGNVALLHCSETGPVLYDMVYNRLTHLHCY